jgi:hypothetical protein
MNATSTDQFVHPTGGQLNLFINRLNDSELHVQVLQTNAIACQNQVMCNEGNEFMKSATSSCKMR